MTAVEICVQDPAGAQVALAGGATRVELCTALDLGGLTPSAASIAAVGALTDRPGWLNVLVRPRAGGYVYSPAEIDLTCADIAAAVDGGADGVVVGALTADGGVERAHVRAFVAAAQGRTVTFHRAFDVIEDRARALTELIDLGVDRVLTSCGERHAVDAVGELVSLARLAAGRIELMAGGGVRGADVGALLAAGCDAVHLSGRRRDEGGGGPGGEGEVWRTDAGIVAAAVSAAHR